MLRTHKLQFETNYYVNQMLNYFRCFDVLDELNNSNIFKIFKPISIFFFFF